MPSKAFERALPFILQWEGGYVNHPADPGGATNKGVIQKVYDTWRTRQALPRRPVRQIDDHEVHAIYEADYWFPAGCHLLEAKTPLDLVQFDTAVNMGTGRAIRFLQQSIGCPIDGDFGSVTLRAAQLCSPGGAAASYCDVRETFYRNLAMRRPKMAVFLKGWLNRLNSLRKEIGLPGYEADIVPEPTERLPDIGEDAGIDWEA